jgi:uncharacterized membrane protein YdcZ (DUF606 family)
MSRVRAIRRAITIERLLPLAIIAGALVLIGSEFTDTFRLEAPGDTTLGLEDAADRHSWSVLVLGLCTLVAVALAVMNGSKPAATATAVFGIAALLIFLLIDLPDAGKVGTFDSPNNPFVQTKAEPEGGFWLLLIGSLVISVCGAALATLSPDQLRALRPGAKPAEPRRSGEEENADEQRRPVPPWGRHRAKDEEKKNGEKKRRQVRPKA